MIANNSKIQELLSPSGVAQGWDVQPANSPRAPSGRPVLYAYATQVLCQVSKDLCGVWPSPNTCCVGLGLQSSAL